MTQLEALEVVAGLVARERSQIATVRKVRDREGTPDGTVEVVFTDAANGQRLGMASFAPGELDAIPDEDLRDHLARSVPWQAPVQAASFPVSPVRLSGSVLASGHVVTLTSAEVRALLRAGSSAAHRTPHLTSALDKLWEVE